MADILFLLVNVIFVALVTAAPVANKENVITASAESSADEGNGMKVVAKRAEEMVYFGNQQNKERVPMKKSDTSFAASIIEPSLPLPVLGEVDQGGSMKAAPEAPVSAELNDRAEAVRGAAETERVADAMEEAKHLFENESAQKEEANSEDKSESAESVGVVETDKNVGGDDAVAVPLPDSNEIKEVAPLAEASLVAEMGMGNANKQEVVGEGDDDLENLEDELSSSSSSSSSDDDSEATGDADVQEFLDELRKESDDDEDENAENEKGENDAENNSIKNYGQVAETGAEDPNYYQTMYHILSNTYRGGPQADDYYNYNYMVPYYRRRRSSLPRAHLRSIRNRHGHVRRIKRDLPSDWLAAYRNLDLPVSDDVQDSLLMDSDEPYSYEPESDELSRYIYANLLNKLANSYDMDAEAEEEVPYEEILPYEMDPETESLLEEYEPEDLTYEREFPTVYRENPYDDYIPDYRKRSGEGYLSGSRRKRYFYPAYEEPETHWGAFVPEKRGGYDDAIQRLQTLALALRDDPRPYYDSLVRGYRKK